MLRRQLPVRSPVPARAVIRGLQAAARPDEAHRRGARSRIHRHFGGDAVLLTDSGTSALALAVAAAARADGGPEPKVALPAFGCYDLATAAQAAGVPAVLYDVTPSSLGPEWDSFRRVVGTDGVVCTVVAHFYGIPVDMERARQVTSDAGSVLVEDAAQGVGGRYSDRPLGAWAPLSVLSFGRGKGLTGGAGGALLARDDGRRLLARVEDDLSEPSRGWGELGTAAAQWMLGRPLLYGLPASLPFLRLGETVYRPPHPPAGMSHAAVGILAGTWDASLREADLRRRHARRLLAAVRAAGDLVEIDPPPGSSPGHLRLPVLPGSREAKARLTRPEARRRGVERGYPRPLSRLEEFGDDCLDAGETFPGAEKLARELVTLPTHGLLKDSDLRRLEALCAEGTAAGRRSIRRRADAVDRPPRTPGSRTDG